MFRSIWTTYLGELGPEEAIGLFAERDWRDLELSTEHSQALVERGKGGSPEEVGAEFRRHADDLGVRFPQGHLQLGIDILQKDRDATIDTLRAWLDLYLALDVKAAVLHAGTGPPPAEGAERERVMAVRVHVLGALAEHLSGTGTVICLENVTCTPLAQDLIEIIEAVGGDRLGICLDTGHVNLPFGDGDQASFIRRAGPHLKALHIADNEGQTDQHIMPFGRGTVNWADLMHALREIGYDRALNYEVPGENRCPMPVRLLKLDYLKGLTEYLLGL